jgi:hypothetical protein
LEQELEACTENVVCYTYFSRATPPVQIFEIDLVVTSVYNTLLFLAFISLGLVVGFMAFIDICLPVATACRGAWFAWRSITIAVRCHIYVCSSITLFGPSDGRDPFLQASIVTVTRPQAHAILLMGLEGEVKTGRERTCMLVSIPVPWTRQYSVSKGVLHTIEEVEIPAHRLDTYDFASSMSDRGVDDAKKAGK